MIAAFEQANGKKVPMASGKWRHDVAERENGWPKAIHRVGHGWHQP